MSHTRSIVVLIVLICCSPVAHAQWRTTFGPPTDGKQLDALATVGTSIFAGGFNGVFLLDLSDSTWPQAGLSPAYVQALAVSGTRLFAGASDGVYSSGDDGANWVPVNDSNYTFAVSVSGSIILAGTDNGLHLSNDGGQTWNAFNTNEGYFATAINGSNCFAGGVGVSVSTDNGGSWNSPQNVLDTMDVNALAVSGSDLFAGTPAGIYLSMDNGSTWSDVTNGLIDSNIYAIDVVGPKIFIGTDSGVFVSVNNGGTWLQANNSLPQYTGVFSFTSDDIYLYAGTGSGVYRRALAEFDGQSDGVRQTIAESSMSVYPDPVQNTATIRYSTSENGLAEVTIVNILGSEVAKIFSSELSAGEHSFTWDAGSLPPGIYECLLQTDGHAEQIPIILSH